MRHIEGADGSRYDQKLLGLSETDHTLVYGLVQQGKFEGSPFDFEWNNYISVIKLYEITGENKTLLRWTANWDTERRGIEKSTY